jgi:hypothetical protein
MGFLNTIMDVGQAAGPIAVGAVIATALSYRGGFGLMALLLLAAMMLFAMTFSPDLARRREQGRA